MNDKYITLKSGAIIRNDITAITPYTNVINGITISSNTAGYLVLFRNGQTVPITIDDYDELKEHLK